MKYMWSKNRIAKYLLPIILKDRKPWQWYVEPFVWGANMIDKVDGNRIWWDSNIYIIALLISIKNLDKFKKITKEKYIDIKNNPDKYYNYEVWFAWICCSYSGKWFWGFAWEVKTKDWIRDYQDEAIRNIEKQRDWIRTIRFYHSFYQDLEIPDNSIIYCDPPYKWTTKYKDDFNYKEFYNWCRKKKKEWHTIFISEYNMPDDFKCVWQKKVSSSLSANWKSWGNKNSVEKLFTL